MKLRQGGHRSRAVVANRGGRLSQGALVEASILARVLGLRLLTLDATLVIIPADVAPRPQQSHIVGLGLTDAVRNINEGAELLADARHNGP